MKILVVGAGAAGSLLGGLLAHAGHELTLVRLDVAPAERAPLTIVQSNGTRFTLDTRLLPAVPAPGAPGGDPELIVFGVKMFGLRDALAACAPWPGVPVLTIENGIGAEEAAVEARPGVPSIAASLTAAVEVGPEGEVRQVARGGIALSAVGRPAEGGIDALARRLAADFASVGMRSAVLRDPVAMKWSKLVANLVANATSAILDMDPAEIYARPDLYSVERRQMLETIAVMRGLGRRPVSLPGAPVPLLALGYRVPAALGRPILSRVVGGARGGKNPSLRLAVHRGESPTEVSWMNGAVARTAARLGDAAPVNERLAALVDEVAGDVGRAAWFRRRPDRLLAALDEAAVSPTSTLI